MRAVFRNTFVVLNTFVRKLPRSWFNDLSFHLKIENEKHVRFKVSRGKHINIGAEINEIGNREQRKPIKVKVDALRTSIQLINI